VAEHRFVRLPDVREASDMGRAFRGLPPTYIPLRNAMFYSAAAAFAEETGAGAVFGGHNRDDLGVFPDAGPEFFGQLEKAFRAGSAALRSSRFRILRPLESKTKVQVIRLASRLGVPLELTWSCHREGRAPCWRCEGCRGRTEAFRRAAVPDPLRQGPWPEKVS